MKQINARSVKQSLQLQGRRQSTTILSLLFMMILLTVASCKSKYPSDILTPDEIKPVLFDIMVATQVKQMDTTAVTRQHFRDSVTLEIHRVLAAHKIDDSLYFRSMTYYEAHPDYLKAILDSTRLYGNKIQDSLQKKQFKMADSVRKPNILPKSLNPRVDSAFKPVKMPVNPTVKEQKAIPVEKVKNQSKKQ